MVEVCGGNIGDEDFDGELVVIADGEFSEEKAFNVVVTDRERGDIVETGPEICEFLRRHNDLSPKAYRELSPAKIDLLRFRLEAAFVALPDNLDQKIIELVLEGKVRVACLIDSDGGEIDELAKYQGAVRYCRFNAGEAHSFVVGHGSSSGFELMYAAQRLHVMYNSSLSWHFSDQDGERRMAVNKLRNSQKISGAQLEELDGFCQFLKRSKGYTPDLQQRFIDEIAHFGNLEGELYFSGGELSTIGLVNSSYAKVGNMRRRFAKTFHAYASPVVREFWDLSKVLVREADIHGDWETFDFEKRRGELKELNPPNKAS